jgi:hypothetical protein
MNSSDRSTRSTLFERPVAARSRNRVRVWGVWGEERKLTLPLASEKLTGPDERARV